MPRKAKSEQPEQPSKVLQFSGFKGGPEVPSFYANAIQTLVSFTDITLLIGQTGFGPDGEHEMWEVARLSLSPQHAKLLAELLTKRVADYEMTFGPIGAPPSEP
jgi:hypothetical protein